MERKSNTGLYVILGVLAVLVLILVVLVAVLLFGDKKDRKDGNVGPFSMNTEQENSKDSDGEDADKDDILDELEEAEYVDDGISVVLDGFQFVIPSEYSCFYADGAGPVVYMEDVFQMKLAITERSFQEILDNPSSVTEKTVEAGGAILEGPVVTELDGRQYVYYIMELFGDKCFVGYTKAAEEQVAIAGQLIMENEDVTVQDMLNVYVSIATTATKTDKKNSTADDILEEVQNARFGERKAESTLEFEDEKVTYNVSSDFYSQGIEKLDYQTSERFYTEDYVEVECILSSAASGSYVNAEHSIQCEWDFLEEGVKEGSDIDEIEIDGKTFYYIHVCYKYEGTEYQKIYAVCDIGDSHYYIVTCEAMDVDVKISMDMVKPFMTLR